MWSMTAYLVTFTCSSRGPLIKSHLHVVVEGGLLSHYNMSVLAYQVTSYLLHAVDSYSSNHYHM